MSETLLNAAWINQLSALNDIYIGLSGGQDSTVLLHALSQIPALRNKLVAIHINHGLMPAANQWQLHCEQFCEQLAIPIHSYSVKIPIPRNVEEQARNERYRIFQSLIQSGDGVITAHHAEDQAETVLLHLMRGSGVDGLAAMEASLPFGKGWLMRPLLTCSKESIIDYATKHALCWIEDESNQNGEYLRNFVRHSVMPLLQSRCPSITKNLVRSAHHCREAKANLDCLAQLDCPDLAFKPEVLPVATLRELPRERLINVLRSWLKLLRSKLPSTQVMDQVIKSVLFAQSDSNPVITFGESTIRRFRNHLFYLNNDSMDEEHAIEWSSFPAPIQLMHCASTIYAVYTAGGMKLPKQARIELRFRVGGERIRLRGQTKQLKKLYQEWGIPSWQRKSVPLLYVDNVLFAVVGYAISDEAYHAKSHSDLGFKLLISAKKAMIEN